MSFNKDIAQHLTFARYHITEQHLRSAFTKGETKELQHLFFPEPMLVLFGPGERWKQMLEGRGKEDHRKAKPPPE